MSRPNYAKITKRLLTAYELADRWQEITNRCYGDKVAEQLKELAPADPYLLYDLTVLSLIDSGKTEQDAKETADHYTHKEWATDLEGFTPIFNKTRDDFSRTVERLK